MEHHTIHTPEEATIVERRELSPDATLFRLALAPSAALALAEIQPGQFVQLSVPGGGEIPISPAQLPSNDGYLQLCVRNVGHVTGLLHRKRKGDRLGIRGPFGRGFPTAEMKASNILLLAGGLGIVPLRALLLYLMQHRAEYRDVTLMYGAKALKDMLFRQELTDLAARNELRLFLTVDFAPQEASGTFSCAVGLLPDLLKGFHFDAGSSYAAICGPPALYRCLSPDLVACGMAPAKILLSLERRMRCGIGRCCHCAIGQLLCCTDGPVFRLSEVQDIPEAI